MKKDSVTVNEDVRISTVPTRAGAGDDGYTSSLSANAGVAKESSLAANSKVLRVGLSEDQDIDVF